jgi:hypothetical protein
MLLVSASAWQVTVYDQVAGRPVDCIVSSHVTPAGSPFESSKGKLWTLEVRLERNTVKLGHAVVCLSPSASSWRLEDATVRYTPIPDGTPKRALPGQA